MQTRNVEYSDGAIKLEGYVAYNEKNSGMQPAVMVVHDWSGRNEFACKKAEKLAELGYIGFAIDMFGKDVRGKTVEEKSALIKPLLEDRAILRKRILAAFATVKKLENVDTARIGIIGFCFGGLCALDLARSGADVRGVVSFHGLLNPPQNLPKATIKAKILALHGYNDPMVPPEQVNAFAQEMTKDKVDWEINIYGNAMHAFANPAAHDYKLGTVYNELADKRSWIAMKNFFTEIFA